MEKLVYLLSESLDRPGAELREALVQKAAPALREAGASGICVDVHDEHVAAGDGVTIRRSDPPLRAMASFWMQNADDRAPCERALGAHAARADGYLVVESRPLVHEPPVGERAPGVNMVTCIRRLPDLPYDEFLRIWHEDHKRVAIEIQSTFGYVRNVVVRALTEDAPPWDGIVEESFPIEALTDPRVWYEAESDEVCRQRVEAMLASCQRFLDLAPLESTPMSEYFLG